MRTYLTLFIVLALGCSSSPSAPTASTVGSIDGDPISRDAFTKALITEQGDAFFKRYVERQLVERAARAANIVVSEEEVEAAVEQEAQRTIKGSFGGEEKAFDAKLAEYGLTYAQWRVNRRVTERHRLLAEGILKSAPAEASVRTLFERRYGKNGIRHRISHILIGTNVKTARFYPLAEYLLEQDTLQAWARDRLTALRAQLAKGANFEALAKAESEGNEAKKGGDLGSHWTGVFGRPFEDAIQATDVGGVTDIVASKKGLHVAKVTGIRKGARYRGHIIFASAVTQGAGTPEEKAAAALKTIRKARARVLNGEAFADVAKDMSEDPVTKARGGALGEFAPGRLGVAADAVLETLPVGKLSPPIRSEMGYLLVKLDEREFRPNRDKKTVRHIYLATDYEGVKKRKLEGELDALAKAEAEALLARLRKGDDFAAVAREESDDELTRLSGGAIPTYRPNLFGPGLDDVLSTLEQGQLAVAKTKRGYHVVRLDGVMRADFASVRDDLVRELSRKQIAKPQIEALVETLRAKATIEKDIGTAARVVP